MRCRWNWLMALIAVWANGGVSNGEEPLAETQWRVPAGIRFELEGMVAERIEAVTRNWLVPAPGANPAMLAMFRDRDRLPARDLLPWSGEFAGKYLTGATQVLALTDDAELEGRLRRFVKELVALQDEDGYLGPFPKGSRLTGTAPNVGEKGGPTWDAWGHYHIMLGLLTWHARTGDAAALRCASRIGDLLCERFLGEKRPRLVDTGSTEMNLAPIHALCLLHRVTGETRYLELAKQIEGEFAAVDGEGKPLAGDYFHRGLAGEAFFETPKPRWESLHPIQGMGELAGGDPGSERGRAFRNLWWSIVELDRHNNGGFSSGEQAQGNPYHTGAIETCCTIAWMAMGVDMLRLSEKSRVADELELSTLNSALGMWTPSGRWSTYNTPMDGVRKANFHDIVFQARPGSPELNCCSVNAARGLGLIGEWAVVEHPGVYFLNWYGPGTISLPASRFGTPGITLQQETDYPRSGRVRIHVAPEKTASFTLALRIPHWSERTRVRLNDGEFHELEKAGEYLDFARTWKAGDVIELEFDMRLRAWVGERESAGRVSLYRGPILMAYDPRWNPTLGDDPPALDWKRLAKGPELIDENNDGSWVRLQVKAADGSEISLVDFASAGVEGHPYRTWLRVSPEVEAIPYSQENPWRTRRVGAVSAE